MGIAGLYLKCMINFVRNCQIIFLKTEKFSILKNGPGYLWKGKRTKDKKLTTKKYDSTATAS